MGSRSFRAGGHRGRRTAQPEYGGDSVFNARIKAATTRIAVAAAGAAAAIGLWAVPAGASPSSTTKHTSFDPAGDVFTCQGGDLTVASGTVYQVVHTSQDAKGIVHFTSTITPRHVTLTDAAGNGYTLSGAVWVGGKGTTLDNPLVATSTAHFVIRSASGGVFGKVQAIEHLNITPNGQIKVKSLDLGNCQLP
jgi:hypothetical protein